MLLGDGSGGELKGALKMPAVLATMPVRFEAAHLCNDSPKNSKIMDSTLKFMAGQVFRVRIRSHYGTLSMLDCNDCHFFPPACAHACLTAFFHVIASL